MEPPALEFMPYAFCLVLSAVVRDAVVCYFLNGWVAATPVKCCCLPCGVWGVLLMLVPVLDVLVVFCDVADVAEGFVVAGRDCDGEGSLVPVLPSSPVP